MDKFVEYDYDKGWWFELFLSLGALISKIPELSVKNNGSIFKEYVEYEKGHGEHIGKDDTQ